MHYYGLLYFYLVGLVDLAVDHVFTSVKITLGLAHIASALGMYLLVRITSRSCAAGLLGALSYALCFWHMQQVLIMGRFPLSLFYALLPWPLYFFERLRLPTRRVEAVCGGALSLGLLPLVHPGYGFWPRYFSPSTPCCACAKRRDLDIGQYSCQPVYSSAAPYSL